jgi:hypothetical protein
VTCTGASRHPLRQRIRKKGTNESPDSLGEGARPPVRRACQQDHTSVQRAMQVLTEPDPIRQEFCCDRATQPPRLHWEPGTTDRLTAMQPRRPQRTRDKWHEKGKKVLIPHPPSLFCPSGTTFGPSSCSISSDMTDAGSTAQSGGAGLAGDQPQEAVEVLGYLRRAATPYVKCADLGNRGGSGKRCGGPWVGTTHGGAESCPAEMIYGQLLEGEAGSQDCRTE